YHGIKRKGGGCYGSKSQEDYKKKKKANSSTSKAGHTRRFGAKVVETRGLTWLNTEKEA
ncbi:hypothetical protein HAX54_028361, partial [Datura stramonium]|nr:hypothetical protein [Datura stramonium]